MYTKLLRVNITAEVIIIDDDGDPVALIETRPIMIYKGNRFNYEEFIKTIEESTLQGYSEIGPKGNR